MADDPLADPNLTCYGCAHSIGGAPFPSGPSGEAPCCVCARCPDVRARGIRPEHLTNRALKRFGTNVPNDQYIATDKLMFISNASFEAWAALEDVNTHCKPVLPVEIAERVAGLLVARRLGKL